MHHPAEKILQALKDGIMASDFTRSSRAKLMISLNALTNKGFITSSIRIVETKLNMLVIAAEEQT